jgi:hypothetical protein
VAKPDAHSPQPWWPALVAALLLSTCPQAAASAAAARALGYRGLADLIEHESLPPRAIARPFTVTAPRPPRAAKCARDCAVVLLAGALGRYRACPHGWDGEDERQLAP